MAGSDELTAVILQEDIFYQVITNDDELLQAQLQAPPVTNANIFTIDRLEFTFTNADLSALGMLVKTHTKGKKPSSVLMLDPSGELIDFDLQQTGDITSYSIAIPMDGMKLVATGAIAPGDWTLILGFN